MPKAKNQSGVFTVGKHASCHIWPGPMDQASFKLEHDLSNAPNLNCPAQASEMHPHFVHLNNYAIDEINKKFKPTSLHCPYLKVNLQKAISAKVLYDTSLV